MRTTALCAASILAPAVALVLLVLKAPAARAADPPFKAGFAERDITPEVGMEVFGNYGKQFGRSVHDPCKVRAAVFDDGSRRVALVGLDTLVTDRRSVLAVRKAIEERCGIPAGNVLVGASHSHSGGPYGWGIPGEYDHASPEVQKLAYERSPAANPAYVKRVDQAIVEAVCQADAARVEARLSFGSGREEHVSFNRRHRMVDGRTFTHPGRGNPDARGYAGPIDPEVGVIGAWAKSDERDKSDTGEKLIGVVVNFACHATTPAPGFSANWIYYLEKTLRRALGTEAPVVFLQGACGDITQVDNLSPYADPPGQRMAQRVGGCVGAEAVKVLLRAEPGHGGPVGARSRVWKIRRRVPDPERVRKALETVRRPEAEVGHTEWVFAKEIVLLDAKVARSPEEEVEVQAVQVGPAVFVSNPAEYFVDFGLELKRRSNFKMTWPVELANGCVGYVPTEEALGPGGGGYETRLTSYSNLEPTAGRQLLEAGLELALELAPGKLPEPTGAPPFGGPWSYGNNPPELK
ncbi:MAG: hypothetical protein HY721_24040 [Planctomycetes bacterium]|nr:hypothetical protein [Planctomycetota bacterium]